jgi:hypothetical protein
MAPVEFALAEAHGAAIRYGAATSDHSPAFKQREIDECLGEGFAVRIPFAKSAQIDVISYATVIGSGR